MRALISSFLVGLLVGLLPVPAFADAATEAKLRFDRGVVLMAKGQAREAVDQFFVSHRLSPNPNALFNIGSCLDFLRQFDEAFSAYSEYLSFDLSPAERTEGEEALKKILPKVARLKVESEPQAAAIFLDRKNLGQYGSTPRLLAASPGAHEVILILPGYHPATKSVVLSRGAEVEVELRLSPLTGQVRISSEPAGASLSVLGQAPLGTTPLTVELPIGSTALLLTRDGYSAIRQELLVREGQISELELTLKELPAPVGRVRLLTNVASALISVRGSEAGFSPLVLELPAGEQEILVQKTDYRPWSGQISVDPDRPLSVEVTLEPSEQRAGRGPWPWVLLTTSLVAGVVGGGLGLRALAVESNYAKAPDMTGYDEVRRLNLTADIMLGASLLGGAATAAAFFFGESSEERQSRAEISHRKGDPLLAPSPGARSAPADVKP